MKRMPRDGAARNTSGGKPWLWNGNCKHALETSERRLQLAICRIVDRGAVDHQRVVVDVRVHRIACEAPDTLFILLHRQLLATHRHRDFLGVWRAKAERHSSVRCDLR